MTVKSRRAALARLSTSGHIPHSPTSSVFSVPTTIHTYSSTAPLRPSSAFAYIPPPPIHMERERRRLRKKSRPKPHAVIELVEIPSQERPSFSDVDLPRPASELDSRRTSRSDLSIHERPPFVASAVTETSTEPSNGPVSIPHTPTKGVALLSRIGSVKKWGVRRKRGDSTAPADANGTYDRRTRFSSLIIFTIQRLSSSASPFLTSVNGTRKGEREATVQHLLIPFRQVGIYFLSFFPFLRKKHTETRPMTRSLNRSVELFLLTCFIYCLSFSLY